MSFNKKAWRKQYRDAARENGLCIVCCKHPVLEGKVTYSSCNTGHKNIFQKCGTRWPCQDAEKVLNAFANSEPCACYPEHCTNTDHGECWCSPTREGNLIIHNQAS